MKKKIAFINIVLYFIFQYIPPIITMKFTKEPTRILLVSTLPLFIIIIFLNYKVLFKSFKQINLSKISRQIILFGVLIVVALIIGLLNTTLGFDKESINQTMIIFLVENNKFFMFFMVCIYAPIVEELVFRSSMFEVFRYKKIPKFVGVVFTILVFGLIHYTVEEPINALFPYLGMSAVLSYSYLRNMEIADSIILHCFQNTLAFVIMVLTI